MTRTFAALAALASLARPLAAQQPDTLHKDTLAPIIVTGVRLPTVGEIARGLTGRVQALTAGDLDARSARSLADALEQLPGVTTSDELGAPAQLDLTLRGFSVSPVIGLPQGVTVYVDGVRANEADANEVNFDLLPLEDVERVEVIYGPSVLIGRNSLGAAVNLVTRRGGDPASREVELSGGSFGRQEVKVHAGNRAGNLDYYLGARYEHEDGWRRDTPSRIATLFGKIGILSHTWDATLSYSGADNRIYQAGSLPESLLAVNPRDNFTGGDYFAPRAHLAILNAQRLVGHAVQLAINAYGRTLSSEQFNVNLAAPNSRQLTGANAGGGAVQLSGTTALFGRPVQWLGGVDGSYLATRVHIYAVPPGGDSLTASVRTRERDVAAYAGASWRVARTVALTAAARLDHIRLPYEDLLDASQSGVNVFQRLSPRVGVTWSAAPSQELYASASRGFRAPAVVEVACADPAAACSLPFALGADPILRPVVATTYEAGWRFHRIRSGGSGVDAGASVYDTNVEDDIYFVAPTATTGYFQNLRATRRSGLELSASLLTRSLWRVYANYGFTDATFQSAAVLATARDSGSEQVLPGDRLPLVPRHRINVGVSVPAAAPGLRITGDVRYVGRQVLRGDEANVTARLPDYGVVDASLLYTHSRYDARVTVRNLLDRRYVSFGTFAANPAAPGAPVQRFLTPGLPRNLEVSLSREL